MLATTSIVIAAGGTGGHIFPGVAVADALRSARPDVSISFIGTRKGLEGELVPDAGYEIEMIDVRPLQRKVSPAAVAAGFSFFKGTFQARSIIKKRSADAVVGMGGYPTLPTIAAARLARVVSVIHESGAIAGLANKVAARFTPNVAVAFEEAVTELPTRKKPRVIGMPLRHEVARMDRDALRDEARKAFDIRPSQTAILVMGGSLGALRLNELALGLAERFVGRGDIRIILKAGADHMEQTARVLASLGAQPMVTALSFIDRMDQAYAAADLAICRAGAGTVAELPAAGLASILVPYPHAPGDHQTLNARPLEKAGAAVIVRDAEATAERVGPHVEELVSDPKRLRAMGAAARSLAKPFAAEELANWVLELADKSRIHR
jgi:UDP-N-acetylglucosamine--N-acetylmuramyl-(pentapeptide) pyrophosphoryl-undecaprenol N-acetylglucosamine transferase